MSYITITHLKTVFYYELYYLKSKFGSKICRQDRCHTPLYVGYTQRHLLVSYSSYIPNCLLSQKYRYSVLQPNIQRRVRDSNPGIDCSIAGFQDQCTQPLCELSIGIMTYEFYFTWKVFFSCYNANSTGHPNNIGVLIVCPIYPRLSLRQ